MEKNETKKRKIIKNNCEIKYFKKYQKKKRKLKKKFLKEIKK